MFTADWNKVVLLLLWSIPEVSNIWPYCCGLIAPCVFFRKSYQAQEKWMSSSELPSYRIWSCCTDWIKSISVIITLRMIAPQLQPKCLFLAMFALGRNFRRFNGTWAIVHSLLYGSVPSSPQREKNKKRRDVAQVTSKQSCPIEVTWIHCYIISLWPWTIPGFSLNSRLGDPSSSQGSTLYNIEYKASEKPYLLLSYILLNIQLTTKLRYRLKLFKVIARISQRWLIIRNIFHLN